MIEFVATSTVNVIKLKTKKNIFVFVGLVAIKKKNFF